MDTWNKVGVIAAVIAAIVVVLQFFGVQPTGVVVKGIHLESAIVGAMMLLTWAAVYIGYRNNKKRAAIVATPPVLDQTISADDKTIPYSKWAHAYIQEICTGKQHTGAVQLHLSMHRDCTFNNCILTWDGYVAVLENCHFKGTNSVKVDAKRFRDAVQFFWMNASVPRNVALRPSDD